MKKQKLLIILILVILISGCVKYDLQMQVNTDKSFNFVLIDAMLNEYAGMETQDQTTSDEYKAKGFEVENYSDNEYTGLKLTKKYNSIDEVSSTNCGTVELKNIIEQEGDMILFKSQKNNTLTTYTADFTYDLTVGESFSSALEKRGNAFPKLLINMVKASELTGELPEALDDMVNYYTETEEARKEMKELMTNNISPIR